MAYSLQSPVLNFASVPTRSIFYFDSAVLSVDGGSSLRLAVLPKANSWIQQGDFKILNVGPAKYFVFGSEQETPIKAIAHNDHTFGCIELTSGYVVTKLSGSFAATVLSRLVPIDFDPEVFGENSVAQTTGEHMSLMIWREESGYCVAVNRSFATSWVHALGAASRDLLDQP